MEVLSLLDHHSNTQIDSHFRVVIIGVQRAKLLLQGAPPVSKKSFAKETSRALYEVLQGDVDFVVRRDARALREANGQTEQHASTLQPSPEAPAPTPLRIDANVQPTEKA